MKQILISLAFLISIPYFPFAQNSPNADPQLAALISVKDSVLLQQKLVQLGQSSREEDYILLAKYYTAIRSASKLDSINRIAIQKYPKGEAAFRKAVSGFIEEKDPKAIVEEISDMIELARG